MRFITLLFLILISFPAYGQRLQFPINDNWEFVKWDTARLNSNELPNWQGVSIPHTWNATDAQSGVGMYQGYGWYRRDLDVAEDWKGKRVFIRFEGVGSVADIYINGKHLGQHKGAYSAFCIDITDAINYGNFNEMLVRADNRSRPDVIPVNHYLFTVFGGIYRPVSLIVTNPAHITTTDYASPGVYIRQKKVDKTVANIEITTKLANLAKTPAELRLVAEVHNDKGKLVANLASEVRIRPAGVQPFRQEITIQKPHLWHGKKDPYLYSLTISLKDGQRTVDSVTQPLGLRSFSFDDTHGFILNGEAYPLRGVCRHQERENKGSALTDADHQEDLDIMMEIGASSLRLAHYQQAEYIYSATDRLGFLVWAEIPFVNTWTGEEGENAKQQLRELIRQNYNHPSIFTWGLHNEVYVRGDQDFPVVLTRELHDIAKTEDPDRPTVAVTGYGDLERPENHLAELQGHNRYFGWYGGKAGDIVEWFEKTKLRPGTFISLSEYGAEGNWQQQSEDDQTPGDPVKGQFYPEGYQSRYHEIHLAAIEKVPHIWGTYVWNLFDFTCPFWNRGGVPGRNQKGLISYDRLVKKDAFYLYKAAWSTEPVLYLADKRLIERTIPKQTIHVYSNLDSCELTINGKMIGKGQVAGQVHFTWDVTLNQGENKIQISGIKNGKQYVDQTTIFLFPASNE
ncbi:MAG: glycoside hydrolase family 2 protein [Holophagaceae bacterium]|nr:glycoside hydrolase family 2 protein [Holophagaceae bacterium]